MKIVCGACRAKYSIQDEKVAGRSVKIRCKKCSEVIVVHGEAPVGTAEDAWHVVVDGEQRGPLAPADIGALLASGTVGWDAYVWREGFAEWRPAEDVKELVDAIMGEPAPASRVAVADLFATQSESAFAGSAGAEDVIASSRTHLDAMTGSRNESSVLFSLANLSALGASGTRPTASAPSSTPRAMATGDGSGLIDIRAIANATGLGAPTPSAVRPAVRADDLLGIGASSLSLGAALAPPVLIAERTDRQRGGSAIILAAAILAVGLLGGASALAYVTTATGEGARPIAPRVQPIAVPTPVVIAELETPAIVAPPAVDTVTPAALVTPPTRPTPHHRVAVAPDTTRPVGTLPETARPRAQDEDDTDLTRLLLRAGGETPHETRPVRDAPTVDPSLPATPERSVASSAMSSVSSAVSACGNGEHGTAIVRVTLAGSSGHVTNAVVSGPFAGTPVGSCVALAVRRATVPPFSQSTFSLTYPFRI